MRFLGGQGSVPRGAQSGVETRFIELRAEGWRLETIPTFLWFILESYKVIPKRNYYGAYG